MSASKLQRFLGDLRSRDRSTETRNHYLSAFKQFCRWLVSDRQASDNPVSHLKKENAKTDRRHDRRTLTEGEFQRLVKAAETGPVVEAVDRADRAMIYIMAAWTGYRRAITHRRAREPPSNPLFSNQFRHQLMAQDSLLRICGDRFGVRVGRVG